jgi:hypothetical protein
MLGPNLPRNDTIVSRRKSSKPRCCQQLARPSTRLSCCSDPSTTGGACLKAVVLIAAIERWNEALAVELAGFKARNAAEEAFRDRHGCLLPSGLSREIGEILERKGMINPYWMFRTHEQITALKSDAGFKDHAPSFHRLLNIQTDDYEENVAPFNEASTQATSTRIDAACAVFDTVPTTLAGMRAKIDFATSVDHVTELLISDDERVGNFFETLYECARLIAQA